MGKQLKRSCLRQILLTICILIGCVSVPLVVSASNLPEGMVIGDNTGVYATSNGEYFIDIEKAMPGAVYRKEITIRNTDEAEPFELGLRVKEESTTGIISLNDHLKMTLVLDGKEIYSGKILGDSSQDWRKETLPLGVYSYGMDRILQVTLAVSSELTNSDFKEQSTLLFHWEFVATRNGKPLEVPQGSNKIPPLKLPQTSSNRIQSLYLIVMGLLLSCGSFTLKKKYIKQK